MRLDVSHHFGDVTCFFIEKSPTEKLIMMGRGAMHPAHWHPKREETFKLLWGDCTVTIDGVDFNLAGNDTVTVTPRQVHWFSTGGGCVLEEVADQTDIAIYRDSRINEMPREERKTYLEL